MPQDVRQLAEVKYELWQSNPQHPSLRFRRLQGFDDLYTVRIGEQHRALAHVRGNEARWVWIGGHDEYERIIHS